MSKASKNHLKIIPGMLIVVFVISACGFGSFLNNSEDTMDATPTTSSNNTSQNNNDPEIIQIEEELIESEQPPDTITVFRLDGTEDVIPLTYTSSTDLLEAKIASGEWTEGEGLVKLLKFFTGEIQSKEISEIDLVMEYNGTGIARWGQDYIADNNNDPELQAEIERLLSKIFPSEEILELISKPSDRTSQSGYGKTAMFNKQASSANCDNLADQGFDSDFYDGENCYLYDEANINGFSYRVYYPSNWQGDEERENLVDVAFKGLTESVVVFSDYGDMEDINMMFSLLPDTNNPTTLAFAQYVPKGTTCPLTYLPSSFIGNMEIFKQTIAHEVFHCFQYWNLVSPPFGSHSWWLEGSAEYFSNVVYPLTNDEHRFLDQFDVRSRNESLQQMKYENFIFFQHAANTYGNMQIIELLRSLGNGGGSASTLASFPEMNGTFFDFVFGYMSTGIKDTSGSMIKQQPIAVTAINPINDEGEETFSTSAFVATRYGMNYEKEKRFLQSPKPDDNVKYSTVKNKERQDPSKWSDLPPELRSTCEEDLMYALAVTTTDTGGSFDLIANVEKVEKAECDPCLLGVWEVDNDSFEEYIKRAVDSQGGLQDLPRGMELRLEIDGHYYVEFKENSEMLSRRDNFTITSGAVGFPGLNTIIDSQGNGEYSTSDGKQLSLYNLVDYVNLVEAYIDDMPINVNMTPGASTYSMFGASSSGPGYDNDSGEDNFSSPYVCDEDVLILDHPEFGELIFNRVEKILPTPVPTMSP